MVNTQLKHRIYKIKPKLAKIKQNSKIKTRRLLLFTR